MEGDRRTHSLGDMSNSTLIFVITPKFASVGPVPRMDSTGDFTIEAVTFTPETEKMTEAPRSPDIADTQIGATSTISASLG
jgi:hypothetical protein